jgi:hypothetical protein
MSSDFADKYAYIKRTTKQNCYCPMSGIGRRFHVGNLKTQAKAAVVRAEIIKMNREGMTNEAIAAKMNISCRSVIRHMNKFLESDCKYPLQIGPSEVNAMRAEARENIENQERFLMQSLTKMNANAETFIEQARLAEVGAKVCETLAKLTALKCSIFGLSRPAEGTATTINNNLQVSESEFLEHLTRYRLLNPLPSQNGQSSRPALTD